MALRALAAAALVLGAARAVAAPAVAAECAGVQILSGQLGAGQAQAYCEYAVGERRKVETFWGATWTDAIRIHVDSSYRISKALTPAYRGNRGFMEMPLRGVVRNDSALLHEIVHIYAPNENRFLAEGLAVYLHQKLAGNPAFPNYGKALDAQARERLGSVESLAGLDAVRTPAPLSSVYSEEGAYILGGSFVGFLIESYGLPQFRKLYDSGSYEAAYGKALAALDREWRAALTKQES